MLLILIHNLRHFVVINIDKIVELLERQPIDGLIFFGLPLNLLHKCILLLFLISRQLATDPTQLIYNLLLLLLPLTRHVLIFGFVQSVRVNLHVLFDFTGVFLHFFAFVGLGQKQISEHN
jgi:hypothetical protein